MSSQIENGVNQHEGDAFKYDTSHLFKILTFGSVRIT